MNKLKNYWTVSNEILYKDNLSHGEELRIVFITENSVVPTGQR